MAPPFVLRDGQNPGWKRATRPPNIHVPRRTLRRRTDDSDADSDSSADEASPVRLARRKRSTRPKARQAVGPAPGLGSGEPVETVVDILSDSSESSGPESPDSPATPSLQPPAPAPAPTQIIDPSPLPQIPPPAAPSPPQAAPPPLVPVLPPPPASPSPPPPAPPAEPTQTPPPLVPVVPDAPSPTPEPIRAPPVTLTPIAPPPRITRVPPPALDVAPIRQPDLPVNEQNPEVPPVAAPILPSIVDTTTSPDFPEFTTSPDGIPDFIPPATTTSSTTTSELPLAPPPRKELDSPSPDISFSESTTSTSTSTSTTTTRDASNVTAFPVEGNVTDANRSRMDADTEHALIAVGSIGSFIFACFISFVIWWCIRRAKNKRKERQSQLSAQGIPPPQPGKAAGFVAKLPFFKRFAKDRAWQNLDDGQPQGQFYEKAAPRGTLQLDTAFYAPSQRAVSQQPGLMTQGLPQVNFNSSPINVSPTSTMLARSNTVAAQHGTYQPTENGTLNNIIGQYAASPNGDSVGQNLGQVSYNQGGMHSQGQPRRHPHRASEISSLSSGFGDGDIVVPDLSTLVPPPAVAQQPAQSGGARESWLSRGNRETIYTESSEDSPPRFRTVNSWVNQQTGRVKRQQTRDAEDVPPVPGLPGGIAAGMPPEPQFTMMMPDGEEPRRPEGYNNAA